MSKINKLAIIGNIANVGITMSRYMSQIEGLECKLIITKRQENNIQEKNPDMDIANCNFIRIVSGNKYTEKINIVKTLNEYDCVIVIGLGGFWSIPFIKKPYVCYATGADMRDLPVDDKAPYPKINRIISRYIFRKAKLVFFSPDQGHVDAIKKLGLKNTIPWRQFVDIDFWSNESKMSDNKHLRIFQPTAQQWANMPKSASKGNEVLFMGFKLFLEKSGQGTLFYLSRGESLQETEKLIGELDIREHCRSYGTHLNKFELRTAINSMDVLVDQFHNGGAFGLLVLEEMACSKPVIVGVFDSVFKLAYPESDEKIPFIQALTPEQVAMQLSHLQSYSARKKISIESREWIEKYHNPKKLACWYLEMIQNTLASS